MSVSINRTCNDGFYNPTQFIKPIASYYNIQQGIIRGFNTNTGGKRIAPNQLAKRLNILIEVVKITLLAASQLSTRTSDEPTLIQKYYTNG